MTKARPGNGQKQRTIFICQGTGCVSGKAFEITEALKKAVAVHEESVASGGERTCLGFRGEQISLRSAKHREAGFDLTPQLKKGYRQTDFFFVVDAEIIDCKSLL